MAPGRGSTQLACNCTRHGCPDQFSLYIGLLSPSTHVHRELRQPGKLIWGKGTEENFFSMWKVHVDNCICWGIGIEMGVYQIEVHAINTCLLRSLSDCHTKRRIDVQSPANPSFSMTPTTDVYLVNTKKGLVASTRQFFFWCDNDKDFKRCVFMAHASD